MLRSAFDHPKFRALARELNIPRYQATGILECLWHFTARFAPQGDVGRFSNAEIADWIGYPDPDSLINIMVDVGWLDNCTERRLIVHDWHEHADQSIRRKLSRNGLEFYKPVQPCPVITSHGLPARGQSQRPEPEARGQRPEPEVTALRGGGGGGEAAGPREFGGKSRTTTEAAPHNNGCKPSEFLGLWNTVAHEAGTMAAKTMTDKRRTTLQARLRDADWRRDFRDALNELKGSSFACGQGEKGWRMDIDFFLRPDTVTKILEGKYRGRAQNKSGRNNFAVEPGEDEQRRAARAAKTQRFQQTESN